MEGSKYQSAIAFSILPARAPSSNSKNPIKDSHTFSLTTYQTDKDNCSWLAISVHSSHIIEKKPYSPQHLSLSFAK